MPNNLDMNTDPSGRRFVFDTDENTWASFGIVPIYDLANRSSNGLVYPELYKKILDIKRVQDTGSLTSIRLTENKPYFYYFYSSDKMIRFKISNNSLHIDIDKSALFRKLTSTPCSGTKGAPGADGDRGRTGLRAPLERLRVTNNNGEFSVNVPTPLDDQPISLRGFDKYGEEQLWEVLINLDGSYEDPDSHVKKLEINGQSVDGQLSDPNNKFKIRQRGPKGDTGNVGKNYVEVISEDIVAAGEFIKAVGSLWYNSITNNFVFNRADLSAVLNNVLSVGARTDIPTGTYWAALQIISTSLKPIEYHKAELDTEYFDLSLPQWTPLSGCYDQKRFTLGYLNYNTTPFDIIKDPYPNYSGCKEPFWFCGNTGDVCDGEINVDPAENNILFIESTSSLSSESSGSSISSASTSSSLSSDTSEPSSESSISSESSPSSSSISESSPSSSSISESSPSSSSISESSPSSLSESSLSESSLSTDESLSDSSPFDISSESSKSEFSESSGSTVSDKDISDQSRESYSSESDQSRESFSSISTSSPFDESSESTVSDPDLSDDSRESYSSESSFSRSWSSDDWQRGDTINITFFYNPANNGGSASGQIRQCKFLGTSISYDFVNSCPKTGAYTSYVSHNTPAGASRSIFTIQMGNMIDDGVFNFDFPVTFTLHANPKFGNSKLSTAPKIEANATGGGSDTDSGSRDIVRTDWDNDCSNVSREGSVIVTPNRQVTVNYEV